MNQYFERMGILAENQDLQPRIRFMLKDIIDLRQDGWVPRKATIVEGILYFIFSLFLFNGGVLRNKTLHLIEDILAGNENVNKTFILRK